MPSHGQGGAGKWVLFFLRVVISAALVYWVLQTVSLGEVVEAAAAADLRLLGLAFLLYPIGYALTIARWRLLLSVQGVRAPVSFLVASYLTAIFFNNILPSTIGGDTVRAYDSWRAGADRVTAVTVIAVDRLLGLFALLAFAFVGLFFFDRLTDRLPDLQLWVLGFTLALLLLTWLSQRGAPPISPPRDTKGLQGFLNALLRMVHRLRQAVGVFGEHRRQLSQGFLLSLLLQVNVVLQFILVARALDISVPALAFFVLIPLTLVAILLPITINGIGVRENVLAFFLGLFGVAAPTAIGFAWVAYGLQLLQLVPAGFVYLRRRRGVW